MDTKIITIKSLGKVMQGFCRFKKMLSLFVSFHFLALPPESSRTYAKNKY